MHDMHDSWFFIGVFAFIFLIWIITGGPVHPLAFSGPTLAQPAELGGGSYLSLPRAPFRIGGSNAALPGSTNSGTSLTGDNPAYIDNSGNTTFGNISPYRGLISMNHSVSGAGSLDPANEHIMLSVSQGASAPVDISGWSIESEVTGSSITLPRGTEVPTSGTVNSVQDIVLTPGENAILISGRSPIGGSFRENKCIGYFSSFQAFSPSLPQNCPAASDELASFYGTGYIRDVACIDYANKLSRCQVALTPPLGASSVCQSFLVKYLNYNGCVTAHEKDADFEGNFWRVYLGRSNSMWRTQHEVVKLLDATGKTVDAFSY